MGIPTIAIQTALLARYRADSSLQGLLVGSAAPTWNIFDAGGVPTNQSFPYATVFPITSQSGTGLVMGRDGVDSWVQITAFTQAGAGGGLAQARGIIARIYALTQPPARPLDLSASGFSNFFLLFESEQELPEQDGISQQIVHRFHLMTQG